MINFSESFSGVGIISGFHGMNFYSFIHVVHPLMPNRVTFLLHYHMTTLPVMLPEIITFDPNVIAPSMAL